MFNINVQNASHLYYNVNHWKPNILFSLLNNRFSEYSRCAWSSSWVLIKGQSQIQLVSQASHLLLYHFGEGVGQYFSICGSFWYLTMIKVHLCYQLLNYFLLTIWILHTHKVTVQVHTQCSGGLFQNFFQLRLAPSCHGPFQVPTRTFGHRPRYLLHHELPREAGGSKDNQVVGPACGCIDACHGYCWEYDRRAQCEDSASLVDFSLTEGCAQWTARFYGAALTTSVALMLTCKRTSYIAI